jgi:hypothetical protein
MMNFECRISKYFFIHYSVFSVRYYKFFTRYKFDKRR